MTAELSTDSVAGASRYTSLCRRRAGESPSSRSLKHSFPDRTRASLSAAVCEFIHACAGRAVNSMPNAFMTASIVFKVGLPCSLNER